jgi:hypothetical protein
MKKGIGEATQFKPGHPKMGGRAKGTRNMLCQEFIADLCANWRENKEEYLRIVGKEEPATIMKLIASLCPKELEISPNALAELTDEQLELIARVLGSRRDTDTASDRSGTEPTLN